MTPEQITKERCRFTEWVGEHKSLWTHIHFACLALRFDNQWIAVAATATLEDGSRCPHPAGAPLISTRDVLAVRAALEIEMLECLLDAATSGTLAPDVVPGVDRQVALSCPLESPPAQASYSEQLDPQIAGLDIGASRMNSWPHARIEFRGCSLSSWAQRDEWYRKLQTLDRRFRGEAYGSLADLAHRLGAREGQSSHINELWGTDVGLDFFAPLKIRLREVVYDRQQQQLLADVEMGSRINRNDVRLAVVSSTPSKWVRPKAVRTRKRRSLVALASGLPTGMATVHLSYGSLGEVGQKSADIKPPPRPWPLLHAFRVVDADLRLLKEGLNAMPRAEGAKHDRAAEFERAVSMLFALLGYSGLWWGPEPKVRPPGRIQPGAVADCLMFSADRNEILVTESTIEGTGGDKVNKLVGRSRHLHRLVAEAMGHDVPTVRVLMAFGVPRSEIPPAAEGALRENGAGILSKEDANDLVRMLEEGRTADEVDDRIEGLFVGWDWSDGGRPLGVRIRRRSNWRRVKNGR